MKVPLLFEAGSMCFQSSKIEEFEATKGTLAECGQLVLQKCSWTEKFNFGEGICECTDGCPQPPTSKFRCD